MAIYSLVPCSLRVIGSLPENLDPDTENKLVDLFTINQAGIKFLQTEFASCVVSGSFGATAGTYFRTFQTHSGVFGPEEREDVLLSVQLAGAQAAQQSNQRDSIQFNRRGRGRGSGTGRGRGRGSGSGSYSNTGRGRGSRFHAFNQSVAPGRPGPNTYQDNQAD